MKAKFNSKNMNSHSIGANCKEKHFYKRFTAIDSELDTVIELRLYATRSTHYCYMWIHDRKHNMYVDGGGKAGGYGYHRASAAAENAINAAGISLSEPIEGRGDEGIKSAMIAIMNALGYGKHNVTASHTNPASLPQ